MARGRIQDITDSHHPATVGEVLALRAAERPEAVAIASPGREPLNYRKLLGQVDSVIRDLRASGVGRAARVALLVPNGPDMAVATLGTLCGTVCAPLNPGYREAELEDYFADLGVQAVVADETSGSRIQGLAQRLGLSVLRFEPGREAGAFRLIGPDNAGPASDEPCRPDDLALVLSTSGSTARPKVVPVTHRQLCIAARTVVASLGLTPEDCCLNIMPLFHVHGLVSALLASLASGGRVVCTPGHRGASFFVWMDEFEPTWYTAVPTMHQDIVAHAAAHQGVIDSSRLRLIRSCSAPLRPQVMEELEEAFRAPVIEAYGMTEAPHQVASNPLPPGLRKPGSVGLPTGFQIEVRGLEGDQLPVGHPGEVVIRGESLMEGYENNPKANHEAFSESGFRTGDQGYLDADGYLFLTGRIKELINRGGEKVSPYEVESVLMGHRAVAEVVVFPLPHPRLGEEVAAAVVLRPGVDGTEEDLRQFVAERLAPFKVPRLVVPIEEIPKGPTGKFQRQGLAAQLGLD
jgi:acyl-CoA synthetase (AMP-forming)/AMP-acid ligase II